MSDTKKTSAKADEGKRVGKVRVYEVARDVGLDNKTLVSKIQSLGIDVKNHMSMVDLDLVQRVKRALDKERQESLVEERVAPTVIRRRSRITVTPRKAQTPPVPKAEEKPPKKRIQVKPAIPEKTPEPAMPSPEPDEVRTAAEEPAAPEMRPDEDRAEARGAEAVDEPPAPTPVEAQPEIEAQPEPLSPETEPTPAEAKAPVQDVPSAHAPEPVEVEPEPAPPAPEVQAPVVASVQDSSAKAEKQSTPEVQEKAEKQEKPEEVKSDKPVVTHRYAPGFKPGMAFPSKSKPQAPQRPSPQLVVSEDNPISAAEAAAQMLQGIAKQRVVITEMDARTGAARRDPRARQELFPDRRFKGGGKKKKKVATSKKSRKTEITTPAQHKRVIRLVDVIGVAELAHQMGIKATEVLKRLWALGMSNVNINQTIDLETATLLANEYGYEVTDASFKEDAVLHEVEDQPEDLESRPPVITVMGHVDHGKTSLLDAIRNTHVAAGEAGGITQHIGASVVTAGDSTMVFLDTPGHEAFTAMRARGAHCTDLVVLVVAANDGVMPQTLEALDHARDAGVPIIVAVNKMDLPDANPDRVRSELSERGLQPEQWGGETIFVEVSARTRAGLDELLEAISLQAEMLELGANPNKPAKGIIIESRLDKARGAMCSVLVQEGTLRVGDTVVTGEIMGKVRAMLDDRGRMVKEAGPCMPVELLGLSGVPEAGDFLYAVEDEKAARTLVEHRRSQHRQRDFASGTVGRTYEDILKSIQSGESKELKLLLKADVHGSSEAVRDALQKLSTEKVQVNVISAAVGGITENDVNLAKAAGAIIAGFNVRPAGKAAQLAEREQVEIRVYDVIYEMLDEVKVMMQGLLPKERREKFLGRAEVRETFNIPKVGMIAGCSVQDGKITRSSQLRLIRDHIKIYDGRVGSLRRFKDDVREVAQGYECGIGIDGYKDIKVGDVIEAYEIEEIAPSLT